MSGGGGGGGGEGGGGDPRFGRDVRTVSGLTLASRITGLARDAALARVFGAGPVADAFLFAFMVPNLFRRLFGEGALSAAFLPVYARLSGRDPEAGRRLGRRVLGGMVVSLSLLVLLLEAALLLAGLFGPLTLAARLSMVLLPYAPMVCAVAILGAMLQVRGRFGPTAAAPLVLNGLMIAALLLPARRLAEDPSRHAALLALAVVVAGGLQVLWSLAALRGSEPVAEPAAEPAAAATAVDPPDLVARRGARDVFGHAIPMMLGLGALQLGTLADGVIAGWPSIVGPTVFGVAHPLDPGAMTTVSLAQRLYQFPLGVFGIAVATAIFPRLARRASESDLPGVLETVRSGLRLTVFIGLPASAGLVLVREPLTATLFEGGDFTAADTARVAPVAAAYGLGVWAYSIVHVLARAFYALELPRVAVRIAMGTVAAGIALNLVLIWTPLREAGLGAATAAAAILQVALLARSLAPRLGGRLLDAATRRSLVRSAALTAVMALAVVGLDAVAGRPVAGAIGGWAGHAARLAILVAGGIAIHGGGAAALRLPELATLLGRSR
ncbi:MAG: murein biosynthesis integral membrane protein MurJ [Planctomycetota bacterium]|jgi:putative peptidoglycan lipid II flippase